MKKQFLFLFLILLLSNASWAQRGWEIGGWLGASNYFGDLNTSFDITHPGIAGGVIGRFNFNDRLCWKMSANYGSISADDADSKNIFEQRRNLRFKSILVDAAGQLEFNFLPYNYFDKTQWFSPYLFAGFNVFYFNPQGKHQDKWYDLRPLGTEGQFQGDEYFTTQLGLVYGGGFKIAFNDAWSMNIEISARKLYTDYLDDVSTVYPKMTDLRKQRGEIAVGLSDPSVIGADGRKIGQLGYQRGESNNNDMYTFLGIGILYYFGDLKCPPFGGNR